MFQTPPEWFRPAGSKILKVIVKQTPDAEAACSLLFNLLLHYHAYVFEDKDRHAAALDLAAEFTRLAEDLAARETRQ